MKNETSQYAGLDAFAAAHPLAAIALAGKKHFTGEGFGKAFLERISSVIADGTTGGELTSLLEAFRDVLRPSVKSELIVRLAKDARAITDHRLREGKPKALLGTTPIINLSTIAQALREMGIEADALCFHTYYITQGFDINLSDQNKWVIEQIPELWDEYRFAVFAWAYINYDVFFYYNDCGIMRPGGYGHANYGINIEEMQYLVAGGKRLYTLTYGADNRVRQATLDSGKFNFCMHCPEPGRHCICDDEAGAKVLDTIDQYATAMLASGLSVDYVPNSYELHYLVIDTEEVSAEPLDESDGPLRVLHAPNHPFFKGSDYLTEAVKTLQEDGVEIELELISGKSNAEVLEAMRRAHIVADQFIGGAYGQTAIEAMARGRPTLCYVKYPERVVDPDTFPVINANPDTLADTLRDLASTPRSELADLGRRSRSYIEKYHSIKALAERLGDLFAATADWPDTVSLSATPDRTSTLRAPGNRNARDSYLEARKHARRKLEALLNEMFENMEGKPALSASRGNTEHAAAIDGAREVYRSLEQMNQNAEVLTNEFRHHVHTIMNFIDARVGGVAVSTEQSLTRLNEVGDLLDASKNGAFIESLHSSLANALQDSSAVTRQELVDAVEASGGTIETAIMEVVREFLYQAKRAQADDAEMLRGKIVDSVHGAGASIKAEITGVLKTTLEADREFWQARADEAEAVRLTLSDVLSNVFERQAEALKAERDQAALRAQAAEAERLALSNVFEGQAEALKAELNQAAARAEAAEAGNLALSELFERQVEALRAERDDAARVYQHQTEVLRTERDEAVRLFERQVEALKAEQDDIVRLFERQAEAVRAERDDIARLFERQAEAVRAERDRTADHAAALQQRIAAIESSFSWRITGPLRRITRTFPLLVRGLRWMVRRFRAAVRKVLSILARPVRWILDPVLARAWPTRRRHRTSPERKTLYPVNARSTAEWLEEFRKLNGRNLKVLHIGNIANNAYNNAKIQRQRGIDADVLCNDYYHIMACPEWEDGTFKRSMADDNFPDWWRAGLQNFKRPNWFAQGPLDASIRYLIAHSAGARSAKFLWRWLTFERWMLCHPSILARVIRRLALKGTGRVIQYDGGAANGILWSYFGAKMLKWSGENATKWPRLAPKVKATGKRLARFGLTADPMRAVIRHLNRTQKRREAVRERLDSLLDGRGNIPSVDWHFNWWYHPYMPLLFNRYDVVQAYATYTAMPFMFGHDYVAYEHGTIRAIPFQDTDEGKLCMATYRAADAVFVTNTDNLDSADRMGLDPARVFALPHAFDSDKLLRFQRASRVSPPKGLTVFFTPARQHWVDGDPGWAKGNDRIIHALRILKDQGLTCRLDAIEWGVDVPASRALAAELGVEHMVNWLPKLKKRDLWGTYLASHAVLDQFVAPAFGGVTFEALMLGRRVITAVDDVEMARFFGDPPPLYNCRTAEEIAAAMAKVINDPEDLSGDGRRNQEWMQIRHSADTIVGIQVERYRNHGDIAKAVASHAGALEIIPDVEPPAE